MSHLDSPDIAILQTASDDPRVGTLLGADVADPRDARVVLIGFPSDEGVQINGGRPGAADGPTALRRVLYTMTPDAQCHDAFADLLRHTVDLGDLKMKGALAANQRRLGEVLASYLERGAVPIVLGGGHETAFAHFLGYVEAHMPVSILNWDAHADVRPLKDGQPHSGSPFRQALEHPSEVCQRYTVAGLQPHSTAKAHVDYVAEQQGTYHWRAEVTRPLVDALFDGLTARTLVTFDLDAVDSSAAPGVSAPAVDGFDPRLWLHAAYRAGRHPSVSSIDVSELNPRIDIDQRTARLAARTVWEVLRGLAGRA